MGALFAELRQAVVIRDDLRLGHLFEELSHACETCEDAQLKLVLVCSYDHSTFCRAEDDSMDVFHILDVRTA